MKLDALVLLIIAAIVGYFLLSNTKKTTTSQGNVGLTCEQQGYPPPCVGPNSLPTVAKCPYNGSYLAGDVRCKQPPPVCAPLDIFCLTSNLVQPLVWPTGTGATGSSNASNPPPVCAPFDVLCLASSVWSGIGGNPLWWI